MTTLPLRLAYADPPYYGHGKLYKDTSEALERKYDRIESWVELIEELDANYDGWAVSMTSNNLNDLLPLMPGKPRIGAWVKPFAAYKRNVRVAYTWEPVVFKEGRPSSKDGSLVNRDFIAEPITMKKGLTGAKPERVCRWILDLMGFKPGDEVHDIFPGTGVMGRVASAAEASPLVLRDRGDWKEAIA